MALVRKSALLPFSAQQLYDLVEDFESYPQFLPWCKSARLISRDRQELCAELEVARMGIRQKFSTCNRLQPPESMDIALKHGPFKRLHGGWRFNALAPDACRIELDLEFEFSGRLIDTAFGAVFNQVANTLVDAFCKRAHEVYGG